jgi:hypothetical protein
MSMTAACAPGSFGANCEHNRTLIYHSHDPYYGFQPLAAAKLTGFSPPYEFYEALVATCQPTLIVEVGVWKGLSAVHLATALQKRRSGTLIAVDTWLGALEFWTQRLGGLAERDLFLQHGYPSVYYHFLSNVVRAGVAEYVIPFPVPSRLASDMFSTRGVSIDLVHVDAAHEARPARRTRDQRNAL